MKDKGNKTIAVRPLIDHLNEVLAKDTHSVQFRQGVMVVMEDILHKSKNYSGFRYLEEPEVPKGELPGIRRENPENVFLNTDNTRIFYY